MRWQPVALLLLLATPARAQITEQEAAGINGAAMLFAMGAMAFGECPKVGYKVNPNGWTALMLTAAPDADPKEFITGGRYSEAGRNALARVGAMQTEAGLPAWCAYMAAWAKVAHPTIFQKLISK